MPPEAEQFGKDMAEYFWSKKRPATTTATTKTE
jgi:hypothetical protein